MDLIAERLVGRELRQICHQAKYDTAFVFEDGQILAWTEVRINLCLADGPLVVKEVECSAEWYAIVFAEGDIRISRVPCSPSPQCFSYRAADDPTLIIIDRGED
ncbi:MAG: hypothetical protein K0M60_01220 [Hydrogenophaga sp.]|nr:hypothetical protein [Hydrogenophaga sp.]